MKKLVCALIALFLLVSVSGTSEARSLDFSGLRPKVAEVPEYGEVSPGLRLTIGIPLIPYMGFYDLLSFGDIPTVVDALKNLRMPEEGDLFTRMYGFVDNVNTLHGKKVNLHGLVFPNRILGISHKWFEVTLDGGIVNTTTLRVRGLKDKLEYSDVLLDEWWTPYLRTNEQTILEMRSRSVLGGELWGIAKVPLKIYRCKLTLLAGVGATLGYSHDFQYNVYLEDEVTVSSGFTDDTKTKQGFIWAIHGMVGSQFEVPKYFRTRVVFQFRGRPAFPGETPDLDPEYNVGVDMKFWKIATLRAEVLDIRNPEYRVELSRKFGINSEVAVGGMFRSQVLGDALGYLTVGLGGKPVKVSTTVLTDGKQVGLLFGISLGYFPQ